MKRLLQSFITCITLVSVYAKQQNTPLENLAQIIIEEQFKQDPLKRAFLDMLINCEFGLKSEDDINFLTHQYIAGLDEDGFKKVVKSLDSKIRFLTLLELPCDGCEQLKDILLELYAANNAPKL